MDRREVNFFENSFEVNFFDEKEKKVEPGNHNTGSPEEKPTIEVSAPALTVRADKSNSPAETVTSACAGLGGLFACLNDDELIDDQTQTDGGKHIKVNDDDDIKTAATSPLDTTQDSSSSGVNSGEADNSNADAKKSDGRQGKYVSSMENLSTNLTSKANELAELDTHLLNWQCKAARRRFIAYRLGHGRFAMADYQATDAHHKGSADDGVLCETGRTSEGSGVGPK